MRLPSNRGATSIDAEQVFGFKHNMTTAEVYMDPKEQAAARVRLFGRAIKIIGVQEITALQPFLQSKLEHTVTEKMSRRPQMNGMENIPSRTNSLEMA